MVAELFGCQLEDGRERAAQDLEYMLRGKAVVVTEAARWVLGQEEAEPLLRLGQKEEGVNHVCKVDLHLVVLARYENQLVCFEFLTDKLGLLCQLNHKAESNLLVVIRVCIPEKAGKCFGRLFVVAKL